MVYNAQNDWVYRFCPSARMLNTRILEVQKPSNFEPDFCICSTTERNRLGQDHSRAEPRTPLLHEPLFTRYVGHYSSIAPARLVDDNESGMTGKGPKILG
jgi:hypothetical protein